MRIATNFVEAMTSFTGAVTKFTSNAYKPFKVKPHKENFTMWYELRKITIDDGCIAIALVKEDFSDIAVVPLVSVTKDGIFTNHFRSGNDLRNLCSRLMFNTFAECEMVDIYVEEREPTTIENHNHYTINVS